MTDEEIIKGLECCFVKEDCKDCLMDKNGSKCMNEIGKNALNLINKQKAEIERLKESPIIAVLCPMWKAEAIREFAEKLKEKALLVEIADYEYAVLVDDIDELVKEMTEVKDNGKV